MVAAVAFEHVDVVFGNNEAEALALLDAGAKRDEILAKTDTIIGVADATISIDEGEICVLMGLSGSGKSSLLRCVNGLNRISRGSLKIAQNGESIDLANCSGGQLRALRTERISMVFQQFALMPWRTIRENVGLGLELSGISKTERRKLVDEKLELVQLTQWAEKKPHELSGGMQQRVGLARALATDADILLMDEPFSALDPLIREHLQEELLEIQKSLKKTIIFVSHDLDEALKIGTHIGIMEGGHIVQYGTPEEIITQPGNDYVRAFVANVNPLNVLCARNIMRPVGSDTVRPNTLLDDDASFRDVLEALPAEGASAGIINADGKLIGIVEAGDVLTALARKPG